MVRIIVGDALEALRRADTRGQPDVHERGGDMRVCRRCKKVDISGEHYNVKFCHPCRLLRRREQHVKHKRRFRSGPPVDWGEQHGTLREIAERGHVRMLAWREDEPELAEMLDRERLRRGLATP